MKQLKDRVVRHKFINFHALLPEENAPKPIGYEDLARCAWMIVKPAQTASERLNHIVKVERNRPLLQANEVQTWSTGRHEQYLYNKWIIIEPKWWQDGTRMNAPMTRTILIDIAYHDPQTDQMHLEAMEWELTENETFAGLALVTTTEKNQKIHIETKEVKP